MRNGEFLKMIADPNEFIVQRSESIRDRSSSLPGCSHSLEDGNHHYTGRVLGPILPFKGHLGPSKTASQDVVDNIVTRGDSPILGDKVAVFPLICNFLRLLLQFCDFRC